MSRESRRLIVSCEQSRSDYPVTIGHQISPSLLEAVHSLNPSRLIIISDSTVVNLWGETVASWFGGDCNFIVVPAGEGSKTLESAQHIWSQLKKLECDRATVAICLGGGMVCDLGGFSANTFMRGIRFMHVPTSLLSQVDASVGGKLGVNFEGAKNLVGSFANPQAVHIDTQFLKTLPRREYVSGFAEIVKHAAILDVEHFKFLESCSSIPECESAELIEIISRSIAIKSEVVAADFHEAGKRKILNFGHTIAHALETLAMLRGQILLHGEAVGWGMLTESLLSERLGLAKEGTSVRLRKLLEKFELLSPLPFQVCTEDLMGGLVFDKKRSFEQIKWTLLQQIGVASINVECSTAAVEQVCREIFMGGMTVGEAAGAARPSE